MTDVTDSETDPTDLTDAETDPPAPSPTPASRNFVETLDCADCPECDVVDLDNAYSDCTYGEATGEGYGGGQCTYGYDFSDFGHAYSDCICYVGELASVDHSANPGVFFDKIYFHGSAGNDCIAITKAGDNPTYEYFFVHGQGGDDTIVALTLGPIEVDGGDGVDHCVGPFGKLGGCETREYLLYG